MLKKITVGFLFSLLSIMTVNAGELTKPPAPTVSETIHLSEPQSLEILNKELFQAIQKQKAQANAITVASGSWWSDSASGPYPTMGGTWYFGGEMRASYVPSGAVMQTLEYYWDNGHLNGWGSQVTVLLYVTDGYTGYSADITSQNSATLNASGIPANYSVYIVMKVGTLQTSLYNPPYVSSTSANVYYTY